MAMLRMYDPPSVRTTLCLAPNVRRHNREGLYEVGETELHFAHPSDALTPKRSPPIAILLDLGSAFGFGLIGAGLLAVIPKRLEPDADI